MVVTETGNITAIIALVNVAAVVLAAMGVAGDGVALERVASASHWTRETRAVDSLGDSIAGVMVVVMVTHHFCVRVS